MNREQAHIRCLLLSSESECALIPAANVAEIIPLVQPRMTDAKPEWFLGALIWREQEVPIVCLSALGNSATEPRSATALKEKVVVLYGIQDAVQLPFYGIKVTQPPRSLVITHGDIAAVSSDESSACLRLGLVRIGDTEATIPNLAALEDKIIRTSR